MYAGASEGDIEFSISMRLNSFLTIVPRHTILTLPIFPVFPETHLLRLLLSHEDLHVAHASTCASSPCPGLHPDKHELAAGANSSLCEVEICGLSYVMILYYTLRLNNQ